MHMLGSAGPDGWMGLDFGTTNSAVALLDPRGDVQLTEFSCLGEQRETFPSVLYFERSRHRGIEPWSVAGDRAIRSYLEAQDKGRLIQSLKAFLGDDKWTGTEVFGRLFTIDELITVFLRHLLSAASKPAGSMPANVIAGRPVHFGGAANGSGDSVAVARLQAALARCGFERIIFELEPVAAAYSYTRRVKHDQLIFIGDFGGGTSDFSVLRVGPAIKGDEGGRHEVLGTGGVALAGDAFDRRIIRNVVAPRLGLGTDYVSPPKKFLPIPRWPYEHLEQWQYLSVLDSPRVIGMLERILPTALIPERVEAFIHLLRNRLGYQLYEAVRRTKFALSQESEAAFEFDCGPVRIRHKVLRSAFEKWIEPELSAITDSIDTVLRTARVSPRDVEQVFLTGGSSFVPAVRRLFIDRFGEDRIAGGDELTSVAHGLALRAAEEQGSHAVSPKFERR